MANAGIVGATLRPLSVKVVEAPSPRESTAVMVTVEAAGPSGGVYCQVQAPVALFWVKVPTEAVSVTVPRPWASVNVPLFEAGLPSFTVTAARLRVIAGEVLHSST